MKGRRSSLEGRWITWAEDHIIPIYVPTLVFHLKFQMAPEKKEFAGE